MENGRIGLKLAAESKNNSCTLISWIKFGQICVGMTHTTNICFNIGSIDIYFLFPGTQISIFCHWIISKYW